MTIMGRYSFLVHSRFGRLMKIFQNILKTAVFIFFCSLLILYHKPVISPETYYQIFNPSHTGVLEIVMLHIGTFSMGAAGWLRALNNNGWIVRALRFVLNFVTFGSRGPVTLKERVNGDYTPPATELNFPLWNKTFQQAVLIAFSFAAVIVSFKVSVACYLFTVPQIFLILSIPRWVQDDKLSSPNYMLDKGILETIKIAITNFKSKRVTLTIFLKSIWYAALQNIITGLAWIGPSRYSLIAFSLAIGRTFEPNLILFLTQSKDVYICAVVIFIFIYFPLVVLMYVDSQLNAKYDPKRLEGEKNTRLSVSLPMAAILFTLFWINFYLSCEVQIGALLTELNKHPTLPTQTIMWSPLLGNIIGLWLSLAYSWGIWVWRVPSHIYTLCKVHPFGILWDGMAPASSEAARNDCRVALAKIVIAYLLNLLFVAILELYLVKTLGVSVVAIKCINGLFVSYCAFSFLVCVFVWTIAYIIIFRKCL